MRMHLFLCFCIAVGSISPLSRLAAQTAPTSETPWSGYSSQPNQDVTIGSDWQPTLDIPDDWWPRRSRADWMGVELGVIGLVRQQPDDQLLAVRQTGPTTFDFLLDANEMRGDMQFGTRANVEFYQLWNVFGGTDLQLGFFGINNLDAVQTISGAGVQPIFFDSVPVTPLPTSDITYSTDMYSGEANLRFLTSRRVRPLTGFRYLKIEDAFDNHRIVSGSRVGGYSKTNNSLFGGQLGAEATVIRWRSFDVFTIGKFGFMHNRVEGAANGANATGQLVVKNYGDSEYSSLIDAEAGVVYNFVSGLSFKAGYQCLYASKVAAGIDQNASVSLLGAADTVTFGSQFWQGLNLSAQLSF